MRKRIFALLLSAALFMGLAGAALAADPTPYAGVGEVEVGLLSRFRDMSDSAWYASDVEIAAQYGILSGRGNMLFEPSASTTLAEALKIAATTYQVIIGGDMDMFRQGSPWYQTYIDFAEDNGFTDIYYANYNKIATRTQFAAIMANALDALFYYELNRNEVEDGAIPDVPSDENVYALYRAGIMTGYADASFKPNSNITRAEIAAIINRFIYEDARRDITLINNSGDGDNTGFRPSSWSWRADGEGYGRSTMTSGKYVREDGNAVLYIESSDSPDYFSYILYVKPGPYSGSRQGPYMASDDYDYEYAYADTPSLYEGEDWDNMNFFTWESDDTISIYTDWLDELYIYYAEPDGVYYLVREKR